MFSRSKVQKTDNRYYRRRISQMERCQLNQRHHLSSRLRRLYISNQLKTIKIAAAAIGRPIAAQPLLYSGLVCPFFSFFLFLSSLVYESTPFNQKFAENINRFPVQLLSLSLFREIIQAISVPSLSKRPCPNSCNEIMLIW